MKQMIFKLLMTFYRIQISQQKHSSEFVKMYESVEAGHLNINVEAALK